MKILTIFTGGTISSTMTDEGFFAPAADKPFILTELCKRRIGSDAEFIIREPFTTLSENLKGTHISRLIGCIHAELAQQNEQNGNQQYDGVIVTHGTDTLQYTASALSYAFGVSGIPIVLVSSNYVLDDPRANGIDNFCAAAEFMRQRAGKGVFVSYRNGMEGVLIHRGSRLIMYQSYSDILRSISNRPYGRFENNRFILDKEYEEQEDMLQPLSWSWGDEYSHVQYITPYAGMRYPCVEENAAAVMLDTYHSGTICTDSSDFKRFTEEVRGRKLPLLLVGAKSGDTYESRKGLESSGVHVMPEASPVAMYMKASMLASEGKNIINDIYKSLGGDIIQL